MSELVDGWNYISSDSPYWEDELAEDKEFVKEFFGDDAPVMMSSSDMLTPEMQALLEPWTQEPEPSKAHFEELHWKGGWHLLWMDAGPHPYILRTNYEGQYGYYRLTSLDEMR